MRVQQTTTTAQAMDELRKMPLFRQLIPSEAGIGWPIPVRKGKHVYATFPCFGMAINPEQGHTILFPPFAVITLDWATQVPVEYVSLRYNNPWSEEQWQGEVGTFPHPAIANMTSGEYKAKRHELLSMYDEMFSKLAQNQPFSAEWTTRFSLLLRLLVEPSLEPYFRAIGPKFYNRFLGKETHQ